MYQESRGGMFNRVWDIGIERGDINSSTMIYSFFFNWMYVKEPDRISSEEAAVAIEKSQESKGCVLRVV